MFAFKPNKKFLFLISLFFVVIFCLHLRSPHSLRPNLNEYHNEIPKIPDQMSTDCLAPNVNYFNPIYLKFYTRRTFDCEAQEPLTTIDDSGLIKLTSYAKSFNVTCNYSMIFLKHNDDSQLIYSSSKVIPKPGIKLTAKSSVANVSCHATGHSTSYKNTHFFVPDFNSTTSSDRPSVIVFFLESLSAGSFHRFMPATQAALASIGNFQQLKGFVKPADNSFPNSVAMISGQTVSSQDEFLNEKNTTYFDGALPFVWKDFKKNGYVTAFSEDMAQVGLFNYISNGFKKSPVDWAPREYWLQMYPNMTSFDWEITRNESYYCFEKNGSKLDLFLEQTLNFIKKMTIRRQPFFFWPFFSQMTHTKFDDFQIVDKPIAKFLMDIKPYLKNTVMIFAGDHGPRFWNFPMTALGRLEERMPYVTIRIPEELDLKNPHLRTNLELNANRLTTWFDVHKTLKDIANNQFSPISENNAVKPINLFREVVPTSRSCREAGINMWYCVCGGKIYLNVNQTDEIPTKKLKVIINDIARAQCPNITFINVTAGHYEFKNDHDFTVEKLVLTIKLNVKSIKVTLHRLHRDWNSTNALVWDIFESKVQLMKKICS